MRIPTSTYRLQINAGVPFSRVLALAGYFRQLGAGDLYFSPVFQARPRSPHGYDVTNPARFDRELGDEAEFERLSRMLRAQDMGIVLDIVPNHMAASADNPWWRDILEHGPASLASRFFDVEWDAPHCGSRIILPVLGRELEDALAAGELELRFRAGEFVITYFTRAFPVDPGTYALILEQIDGIDPALIEEAEAIGPRRAGTAEERARRREASEALKATLMNSGIPDQVPFSTLAELIEKQAYRLEFWRTGTPRLNYRRFFDITDLAGVRVEDDDVFATTHSLILELIHTGQIDGVRVDHVDGLRDPAHYLRQLRAAVGDTYVVVEKILAPKEDLPERWPIEGTTGYDFVGLLAGLYCEAEGLARITECYQRRTGMPRFVDLMYEKKKLVIGALFAGELRSLAAELARLAQLMGMNADDNDISECIAEVTACLPVYRTYISDEVDGYDRCVIKNAVNAARHRAPGVPDSAYVLLRNVLLGEEIPDACAARRADFIANWQQFTGPVMAKGVEDTAFYTDHRLIALSEVGAHPDAVVASAREFHDIVAKRARRWPYTMNASSTHDTKRSEDVRARILVLSELPDAWESASERWLRMAERHRRAVNGGLYPEINEQLLIFQTLLGVWPLEAAGLPSLQERLRAFLRKSAREAKQHSSWLAVDEAYEQALFDFTDALLGDERFLEDFTPLRDTVAWYGALNSLSQLTVKLGAPGIPDIYQGNESWIYSLVDPDNRRPIDFHALSAKLATLPNEITPPEAAQLMREWQDGRIKMHITRTGLRLRRSRFQLFANGDYVALEIQGRFARNVIAFARRHTDDWALIVAGRYFSQLGPQPTGTAWADTLLELPADAPHAWRNVLTGEVSDGSHLEAVLATYPFALLVGA
ncbi:MAG: malto-oligosyltrehalose synthase [Gemmatimonadota bacterium]